MPSKKYIPGKFFTGKPCKNGHISERWNYNGMCVDCKRDSDRSSNLKAGKRYNIKAKYGLTMDQVEELENKQGHKCAICEEIFETTFKVQIDHCHTIEVVRGLLCINCNWLLGHSKDNPDLLRRAASYLERFK